MGGSFYKVTLFPKGSKTRPFKSCNMHTCSILKTNYGVPESPISLLHKFRRENIFDSNLCTVPCLVEKHEKQTKLFPDVGNVFMTLGLIMIFHLKMPSDMTSIKKLIYADIFMTFWISRSPKQRPPQRQKAHHGCKWGDTAVLIDFGQFHRRREEDSLCSHKLYLPTACRHWVPDTKLQVRLWSCLNKTTIIHCIRLKWDMHIFWSWRMSS